MDSSKDKIQKFQNYIGSEEFESEVQNILASEEYKTSPNKSRINPWNEMGDSIDIKMNNFNAMGLQILSASYLGLIPENYKPSKQVKQFMTQYIENTFDHKDLANILHQDGISSALSKDQEHLIDVKAVRAIKYYAFKTRKLDVDYLEALSNKIDKKQTFSLKEIAIISDVSETSKIFERLDYHGLLDEKQIEKQKVLKVENYAKNFRNFIVEMNDSIENDLNHSKGVVLVLDNNEKKLKTQGKEERSFMGDIRNYVSKNFHASMVHFTKKDDYKLIYQKENGNNRKKAILEAKLFHINPDFKANDQFNFKNKLFANLYEIDVTKLVNEKDKGTLKKAYGEEWENVIQEKFKVADNKIHNQDYLSLEAKNSFLSEMKIFMAKLVPFGNKQFKENNYNKIYSDVISGKYSASASKKHKMLCSQFCAVSIVSSIMELNEEIKKDLSNKNIDFDRNKELVQIPFGKHENLKIISPDRLKNQLKSRNCINQVTFKALENKLNQNKKKTVKNLGSSISL